MGVVKEFLKNFAFVLAWMAFSAVVIFVIVYSVRIAMEHLPSYVNWTLLVLLVAIALTFLLRAIDK